MPRHRKVAGKFPEPTAADLLWDKAAHTGIERGLAHKVTMAIFLWLLGALSVGYAAIYACALGLDWLEKNTSFSPSIWSVSLLFPLLFFLPILVILRLPNKPEQRIIIQWLRTRNIVICPKCGYDMTAVHNQLDRAVCAECGHDLEDFDIHRGFAGWWLKHYASYKPYHTSVFMRTLWPRIRRFGRAGPTRREWLRIEPGRHVPWYVHLPLLPCVLWIVAGFIAAATEIGAFNFLTPEVSMHRLLILANGAMWSFGVAAGVLFIAGLALSWNARRERINQVLARRTELAPPPA